MATLLDDGSWQIQGRRVGFPVRIGAARAACSTYLVRTGPVRALLAGTGLRPVGVAGRTVAFLLLVDYRVNDLGTYDEVGLAFAVRHGRRTGVYVHQLPVTETFTMEAGRALWGLPKWLAGAILAIDGSGATGRLATTGGTEVLATTLRAGLRLPGRFSGALTALAPVPGGLLASRVRVRASGVRIGRDAVLEAGSGHPLAEELRVLGLPGRRPLLTTVVADLAFDMDPARRL